MFIQSHGYIQILYTIFSKHLFVYIFFLPLNQMFNNFGKYLSQVVLISFVLIKVKPVSLNSATM